jgi:hypothetical protein
MRMAVSAGADELVEFPFERIFHIEFQGDVLVD